MPAACRGIDVVADNFFPLIDPIIHGEGHRVPSDLAVLPDNPVHGFHGVSRRLHTPDQRLRLAENLPVRACTRNYVARPTRGRTLRPPPESTKSPCVRVPDPLQTQERRACVPSFLCNTRSTEGKHHEETYCEAAEGSHGSAFVRKSQGCSPQRWANRIESQRGQIPMSPSNYIRNERRVAGCERRSSGRMVGK